MLEPPVSIDRSSTFGAGQPRSPRTRAASRARAPDRAARPPGRAPRRRRYSRHPPQIGLIEEQRLDRDLAAAATGFERTVSPVTFRASGTEPVEASALAVPPPRAIGPSRISAHPERRRAGPVPSSVSLQMGVLVGREALLRLGIEQRCTGRGGEQTHARRLARKELTRHAEMQEQARSPPSSPAIEVFACAIEPPRRVFPRGSAAASSGGVRKK